MARQGNGKIASMAVRPLLHVAGRQVRPVLGAEVGPYIMDAMTIYDRWQPLRGYQV